MSIIKRVINKIVYLVVIIFIIGIIWDSYKKGFSDETYSNIENTVIDTVKIENNVSDSLHIKNEKLNIVFFDVGQADSTLIVCDGKTILIDAGNTFDGRKLVDGMKNLGIEKIDYVFGTHAHEDHLGGMSYIIDNFDIGNYYMPYCSSNENSFYSRLLNSLSNKNMHISQVEIGDIFTLGNGLLEVLGVKNDEQENLNETSIILKFTYGNLKYLFMSDAEIANEKEYTWDDIDVLKVGHHGSISSTSNEFLNQVLPEVSIISVGKNNDYDLPNDSVLKRLYEIGSDIYRTDTDGTLQIISDGEKIEIVKSDVSFDG